ncbi:N,N'-diacetyllegionaminate synthase [Halpernia humi]|uniref:N,N'-diacetyllegionaminate synthase n=1 Tax=Halpernia humi TaxID=493375 RepID=A0A1H6A556_9FLAO|nr:N-acetylneuraminate synthase family protein [Halpernia humi]SEG42876.1 N,N'-diacetyllegionaminate synthase [Halpernia humi]
MLPQIKPYFIAETAFHHEGDKNFLLKLIDDFCNLDINAIKFHLLFDLEDYIIENHPAVDVLKNISIKKEDWKEIFNLVNSKNRDLVLLTNDLESLKWVNSVQNEYNVEAIELHSTGLNDIFLLKECLNFEKTIILGVGGSTIDEIFYAVDFLKKNGKNDILLMHGFQNYPTNYEDINFKRMQFLREAFSLPIGYADHTDPTDKKNRLISVLPQAMGFNILEKHVTNVLGEKRIDAQAAVSIEQMAEIIEDANTVFKTIGKESVVFSEAEKNYGNTGPMKKAIVARENIKKGQKITLSNVAFKRTETSSSLLQKDIVKILGAEASKDIAKDEIISFNNVEYLFQKENFDQFFVSEN